MKTPGHIELRIKGSGRLIVPAGKFIAYEILDTRPAKVFVEMPGAAASLYTEYGIEVVETYDEIVALLAETVAPTVVG